MPVYLHNISRSVPEHKYEQTFLREKMKEYVSDKRSVRKIIHRIYSNAGIQYRHSVVKDFHANGDPRIFFRDDGSLEVPSTGQRNSIYAKKGKEMYVDIARKLLSEHPEIEKEDITHIVTVSCTGFFAPGPGFEIIKRLGLSPTTQRYHLGFMGCYAMFPALKMAKSFCQSDKDAVVMVISLELCSLHFQASETVDHLISASIFADGGAGALVSRRTPPKNMPHIALHSFASSVVEQSESDMAWTIGDTGFDMILSTYVPEIINSNLPGTIQPLFQDHDTVPESISHWAIHPGGRAILDKIENSFKLEPDQLASSRAVLSEYGNMSSATILFVLKHMLELPMKAGPEPILAMAFGPGLTIESGLFTKEKSR